MINSVNKADSDYIIGYSGIGKYDIQQIYLIKLI